MTIEPGPPAASPDVFEQILRRHRRRQLLTASGILVVVLVVGGLVDLAARARSDSDAVPSTVMNGSAPSTTLAGAGATFTHQESFGDMTGESGFPLTKVLRRTAGQVDLRLYRAEVPANECDPSGPCPPPDCVARSYVVEGSTDAAVGFLHSGDLAAPPKAGSPRLLSWGQFGVAEGDPVTLVLADAGDEVHAIRVSAAGHEDQADVVKGVAALALPGAAGVPQVVGLDAAGNVLGTAAPVDPSACDAVPPPLPPDSGKPPADRTKAEAQVREAVERVFGSDRYRGEDQIPWIEDGEGLRALLEDIRVRYADAPKTTARVLDEVTFQGPEHASFRWHLTWGDSIVVNGDIDHAVFQDGHWKVTRAMWCRAIERGAGKCPPAQHD